MELVSLLDFKLFLATKQVEDSEVLERKEKRLTKQRRKVF